LALALLAISCGGKGCTGCSTTSPVPTPLTPNALMVAGGVQARVTQHGADVLAAEVKSLLKLVLGANAQGVAVLDVAQWTGQKQLAVQGGLGLFQGKAVVRDLVLTLDLKAVKVSFVDGSQPARVRVALDHAQVGVVQGVVAGETSVLGVGTDAACHLLDGVDVGKPSEHLTTVSAELDLVLAVDAAGKLAVSVAIGSTTLHDIGFDLAKDCGLPECGDKVLLEDPCLECGLCSTGKLASNATAALKSVLGGLFDQLLTAVGNGLAQGLLAQTLNGKPLDVELPVDLGGLVAQSSPTLGGLLGPAAPLRLRLRPAPAAFAVKNQGLDARFDAAVFAPASPAVAEPGADATSVFAQLPQGSPPPLPQQMAGQPVDVAVHIGRRVAEEATWSLLRSGLLATGLDSGQLRQLSDGRLLVTAGLLDLLLPGVRQLTTTHAAVRIETMPSARPEDAPRLAWLPVVADNGPSEGTRLEVQVRRFEVRIAVLARGRWLTVLETRADLQATATVRIAQGKLLLQVEDVAPGQVDVSWGELAPHAQLQTLAPAAVKAVVPLLLSQPLAFDLDLEATLAQVLALPVAAEVVGLAPAGDWLVLGVALGAKKGAP
jgi:hypothetical protein